ncbi:LytTR family DNA-binding domain-containing protein [Arcicella sp. LKC2W]|uniref:LytR/AlgR family response regulator transcription factor n=1 Tax=Arcicella sp. LKC2W TaxID=2984198 RepID=UPI002B1EB673|nr:LytTR family DNA-binding domain-containing protein [Arcicella sp. LKC2W]MEA5458675.1 LytTR family DNA-binding domain-containing protein [Arcicella sp. LKC2W]
MKIQVAHQPVDVNSIVYIAGDGTYSTIYTEQRKIVNARCVLFYQKQLPPYFIRIHRKYLVNSQKIKTLLEDSVIMQNGTELPISRRKKNHIK